MVEFKKPEYGIKDVVGLRMLPGAVKRKDLGKKPQAMATGNPLTRTGWGGLKKNGRWLILSFTPLSEALPYLHKAPFDQFLFA
jgi:hypothetical protein